MNKQDALTGALVADAAAMGLHWLYDQEQIKLVETTGNLLFRQPDANVYEDKRGVFVHSARRVGELSHYGKSARIVRKLASDNNYSTSSHQEAFLSSFGPCGSFHGYTDRPTKHLIGRILLEGDELTDPSGMDDDQMPAICVVPGLFATDTSIAQTLEAAKVISTNTDVLTSTEVVHSVLSQLASGVELKSALVSSAENVKGELGEKMREALKKDSYEPLETAQELGMACYVKHAIPLTWYLLNHANDFESVVLDNIRCGGDTCGRSMALGSIAGLAFGVPDEMLNKTNYTSI